MIWSSLIYVGAAVSMSAAYAQVGPSSLVQSATESINRGEAAEVIPLLDDVLESLTEQFGRDSTALIEPLALRGKALAELATPRASPGRPQRLPRPLTTPQHHLMTGQTREQQETTE